MRFLSRIAIQSMEHMTRTFSVVRDMTGAGATTLATPSRERNSRNSSSLRPSLTKSSSPSIDSLMSSTMFARLVFFRFGSTNSSTTLLMYRKERSALRPSSTPGLRTFITTSLPWYVARWTWLTEAEPKGVGSMYSNFDTPTSFWMTALIFSNGTGSVLSSSFTNSCTYSGGKSVGLEAMNCPSLTYVPPGFSKRMRSAAGREATAPPDELEYDDRSAKVLDRALEAWRDLRTVVRGEVAARVRVMTVMSSTVSLGVGRPFLTRPRPRRGGRGLCRGL